MRRRIEAAVCPVKVPKNLSSPHGLIERLLRHDEAEAKKSYPFDRPRFASKFEERRLLIVDAVFNALTAMGCKPSLSVVHGRALRATVGDHGVEFSIDSRSVKSDFWPFEEQRFPKFGPEEKLQFQFHTGNTPAEERPRNWPQSEMAQSLGVQLTQFVIEIVYTGEVNYRRSLLQRYEFELQRLMEARKRQQEQQAQERRNERQRIEREKQAAIVALLEDAERLQQAQAIRNYVGAVRSTFGGDGSEKEVWEAWALSVADGLDPLLGSPPWGRTG